jgi:hypothetical protein
MDVNPQMLKMTILQSGTDAWTVQQYSAPPGQSISFGGTRPLVMEILKVYYEWGSFGRADANLPSAGATSVAKEKIYILNNASITEPVLQASDPNVICFGEYQERAYTETTNGLAISLGFDPLVIDYTDGDGHGMIYAGKSIYIGLASMGTGTINAAGAQILYRMKEVSEEELLGYIISTQQ